MTLPESDNYPARLLLARHGETDWNRAGILQGHIDIGLNDTGRQQAQALARRLGDWTVDQLISSDLRRSAETATIVGASLGLTPKLSPAWREMDHGAWVGLTQAQIADRYPDQLAALVRGEDIRRGGGESMGEVQTRVAAAFEQLRQAHPGETILIVGHGGSIKALIGYLIGLEIRFLYRLSVSGNTNVSVIEFEGGQPRLCLLNDTCHMRDSRES